MAKNYRINKLLKKIKLLFKFAYKTKFLFLLVSFII